MANVLIDTLEFDNSSGYAPDVALAIGTIYAAAYEGPNDDIFVRTFNVAADGTIGAVLDSQLVDAGTCRTARIIQLADGYLAIVYTGTGDDGFLATISVDAAGNIALVDSWEFDAVYGYEPFILRISGTIYAIAYAGNGANAFIKTLTISNIGIITAAWIDTLNYGGSGFGSYVGHISGDIWGISYRGMGFSGHLCTVEIDAAGNIGAAVIDAFTFADDITVSCGWPMFAHVNGLIYAVTFIDTMPAIDTAELFTIEIQNNGMIAAAVTDAYQLAASGGGHANIGLYDTNEFLITFHVATLYGLLTAIVIVIANDGTIGAVDDTLTVAGSYNNRQLETGVSRIWVLVSQGSGNDGWAYTIGELTSTPTVQTDPATEII